MDKFLTKFYELDSDQIKLKKKDLVVEIKEVSKNLSSDEKSQLLGKLFLHPKSTFEFDTEGKVTNKEKLWQLYKESAALSEYLKVTFTAEESLRFLPVLQQNPYQNEVVLGITNILVEKKLINLNNPLLFKFLLRQFFVDAKFTPQNNKSILKPYYQSIFTNLDKNLAKDLKPEPNKMVDVFFWVAEHQLNIMDRFFVENWEKKEFNDFKTYFYQTEFGKSFVDDLLMKRDNIEAFRKGVEKLLLEVAKSYDSMDPFYLLKSVLSIVNQKIKLQAKYKEAVEQLKEKQLSAKILIKEDFKLYFSKLSADEKAWAKDILPDYFQKDLALKG